MPEIFKSLTETLRLTANVKSVFGDPVSVHGKTIIPVARIVYGFGGGSGTGRPSRGAPATTDNTATPTERAEGEGGGGGGVAWPLGVFEVTQDQTRFIPAHQVRNLIGAAALGIGVGILWAGVFRRSRSSSPCP